MLANRPRQFQLSLAVSELVRYSSCHVHVTIRHTQEAKITKTPTINPTFSFRYYVDTLIKLCMKLITAFGLCY
jgi:hypothetical protein